MKKYIIVGASLACLAVLIGAFGAHALKDIIGENGSTFETGSKYHFYHSLALIIVGLLGYKFKQTTIKYAGYCFIIGILFFSGSLYLLAMRQGLGIESWKWLGPITPIGGLFFIIGWIMLIVGIVKSKEDAE